MPSSSTLPDSPTGPLAAAIEHLALARAAYARLGRAPLDADALEQVRELLEERPELVVQLGEAVLEALAHGVDVHALDAVLRPDRPVADEAGEAPPTIEVIDPSPPAQATHPRPDAGEEAPDPTASSPHIHDDQPADDQPTTDDPPVKPAPVASLLALQQRGIGGGRREASPRAPSFDPRPARTALDLLGAPTPIRHAVAAHRLRDALLDVTERIDDWISLPAPIQRDLLGLCSSLARHLQDEVGALHDVDLLVPTFRRMTSFSKAQRPGFVPGLSRSYSPHGSSWLEDASVWYQQVLDVIVPEEHAQPLTPETALRHLGEAMAQGFDDGAALAAMVEEAISAGLSQSDRRLVDLLTPHQSLLRGAQGLKTLKTHLKKALDDQDDFESVQDAASPIPEDWPHRDLTEGRVAVILGGDSRPAAMARLKEAFGFAELSWEGAEPRRTAALARRVQSGSVDLVLLLLRFIHHSHSDVLLPACKEASVPLVQVETGYGVDAVRRAIDKLPTRFHAPPGS
jgi:hypothetical protein